MKIKRVVATLGMVGAGMLATAAVATAGPDDTDEQYQNGLVNVQDVNATVAVQLCNNHIPVNVLGVQVPLPDNVVYVPLLSPQDAVIGGEDICEQTSAGANE